MLSLMYTLTDWLTDGLTSIRHAITVIIINHHPFMTGCTSGHARGGNCIGGGCIWQIFSRPPKGGERVGNEKWEREGREREGWDGDGHQEDKERGENGDKWKEKNEAEIFRFIDVVLYIIGCRDGVEPTQIKGSIWTDLCRSTHLDIVFVSSYSLSLSLIRFVTFYFNYCINHLILF